MTGLDALQRPSLDALLPRLVERDELPAAGALSSLCANIGMIAGPALGGCCWEQRCSPSRFRFSGGTMAEATAFPSAVLSDDAHDLFSVKVECKTNRRQRR